MSRTNALNRVMPARLRVRHAWRRTALAFGLAWLLASAWGSLVQTHFNLQALVRLGVEIPLQTRALMSAQDLVGFGPIYAGVVLAAWLPAFGVALFLARRWPAWRSWLLPSAAGTGLVVALKFADVVAPMPVFIDATRGLGGLLLMAAGCVVAGILFERLSRPSRPTP
ncbi:hypothetical protein ACSFA3_06770 [Variovorax sp. RHLX14]|uniref:hypothetical protein n=1 Tax=Variovorax sp. RHLX14 TaxID=1259731 RepID=UPI003F46694B